MCSQANSFSFNKKKIQLVAYEGVDAAAPSKLPYADYLQYKAYENEWSDILEKYDTTIYDPMRAVSKFEEQGFKKGSDGIWVTPDGNRLSWTVLELIL